jgi:DNA-binding NarL/FixJ family response regulator
MDMHIDPMKPSAVDAPQDTIRVALVDDHAAVRAGLVAILGDEPRIDVVATATTAAEAYQQIEREQPDVAILDYNLPGEDGLSLCARLKSLPTPPRVLILSAFVDDALALMAVVAGADGVMSKAAPANLNETVMAMVAGTTFLPKITLLALAAGGSILPPEDLPILGMLIHGVSADDIAITLDLEPSRLARRRRAILERLRRREFGHVRRAPVRCAHPLRAERV